MNQNTNAITGRDRLKGQHNVHQTDDGVWMFKDLAIGQTHWKPFNDDAHMWNTIEFLSDEECPVRLFIIDHNQRPDFSMFD